MSLTVEHFMAMAIVAAKNWENFHREFEKLATQSNYSKISTIGFFLF